MMEENVWGGLRMEQEKELLNSVENAVKENEYDSHKWKKIMDTTQSNYANMLKRLDRRNKVSNYVLIYYSIFLIVFTLTAKYFPEYFNDKLGEYFGIILSIIVLAYSLINNSANYPVRIAKIEDALNQIKTLKRNLKEENIEECKVKYYAVTDTTERREDVDFFVTVKHLCNEYNINWFTKKSKSKESENKDEQEAVVNNYISEINVFLEECKIIFEFIWYGILFLTPVMIFIICILTKINDFSPIKR